MDTPPAAAAGSMEIEEVAVVLVLVVPVFVPDVVSESVAVLVLEFVPVVVSEEVWDAVLVVAVVSEVAASVVVASVVAAQEVSVDHDRIRWILLYLLAYLGSRLKTTHLASMAKPRRVYPAREQCRARSKRKTAC
jgi:hypothetical protein